MSSNISQIVSQIESSRDTLNMILSNDVILDQINKAATLSIEAYKNGGKTIWAGNGGSAADAQHLAGEMVSKFYFDRPGLPAIALNTDTSIVTAIGNDYGFDKLFSRQVQANGKRGDIFFGISTSGNSKNIVEALKLCREMGIVTVGFNGAKIGTMDELCDICIKVPSPETPRIQEAHTLIGHIICYLVEDAIFGELKPQE